MKPPPPKPLAAPGDILEGVLTSDEETVDQYGNKVLDIKILTDDGQTVAYRCPDRLWRVMYNAVGDRGRPRIRIVRTADLPAVGNRRPARAWTVELVEAVPQPPPVQPRSSQGPAW